MTTIGVFGAGDSNRRNTTALVKDFVSQFESFSFVLPATVPTFSDAVRHVADLAVEQNYEAAFVADKHDVADLEDYENIPVSEVAAVEDVLGGVDHLLVAWSDTTDDDWIESLLRKGVKVYDLTDGLFEITITDDEPAASPEAEEPAAAEVEEPADEAQATIPPQPVVNNTTVITEAVDTEAVAQRAAEIVLERLRAAL